MTTAAKRINRARSRINLATVNRIRADLQQQQIDRVRVVLRDLANRMPA